MVVKSIKPDARASATGVSFYQRAQNAGAYLRPEKILFIGNYQDGKKIENNVIYSGSGNADDVGVMMGFGSPLHRMALKAFPSDGSGANVETYFLPVPQCVSGTAHKVNISAEGTASANATLYLRYKEQTYEAAADLAVKVANIAHSNPALDPKGVKLNSFNYEKIPFTLVKGASGAEILETIKEALDEYVEVPFLSKVDKNSQPKPAKLKTSFTVDCTGLTAEDYSVAYSVDGGEVQEISIGALPAENAGDIVSVLNSKLSDVIFTASAPESSVSEYTITSKTSGTSSKIVILIPASGTDLFAALNLSGSAFGSSFVILSAESKVKGETSKFEIDIVNSEYRPVLLEDYGVNFTVSTTETAAGLCKIDDYLKDIGAELGITRVCSQFSDDNALDAMKEYFLGWREPKLAQYVVCYTAKEFPEMALNPGTVDIDKLVKFGNSRSDDSVNVQIYGDYGRLRSLDWQLRDKLLKAGISNLEPLCGGGYEIGDLCTFYHKKSNKKTLYNYDRDICCMGNVGYDLLASFTEAGWKSAIIVANDDDTTNPRVKRPRDYVDKLNSRIRALGKAGILANAEKSTGYTIAEIDDTNPDRINANTFADLSGVSRILDVSNALGFNYGG